MKKAIGIILLWIIGSTLGGVPIWLILTVSIGIFALSYFGFYHRYIGVGAGVTFVWGLGVLTFGLPTLPSIYHQAPGVMAETSKIVMEDLQNNKTSLKTQVAETFTSNDANRNALIDKLAALEEAREKGAVTDAEFAKMRSKILEDFASMN
jgi:hypothetical protein